MSGDGLPETVELYHNKHERTIIIRDNGKTIYSMDTYKLWPAVPEEAYCLQEDTGKVRLCYLIRNNCTLVLSVTPERIELINYRLIADRKIGPEKVFEICEEEARQVEEALLAAQRREGQ